MSKKDSSVNQPQPIDFLEEIANFTFTSKYARYNEKEKRRETWHETVARLEKMHLKRFSYLSKEDQAEIKWAFDRVREKLVVPSMRSLQFGGKAIEAHEARTFNCSVRHIDSLRAFAESFYLLLCGCGLGIGLSNRFLDRLPDLVDSSDKTGTVVVYAISDTIEGWSDSVEALLMCYFKNTAYTGRKIVFDYSKIRKKGALLKTGGGKAPGYKGLKQTHQRVKGLLDHIIETNNQRRLRTIDAYDILMHCADAVLSGGIRRSATSVVFSLDDEDMMNAKTFFKVDKVRRFAKDEDGKYYGQVIIKKRVYDVSISEGEYKQLKDTAQISWVHIEPQRARSNNSVLLLRDKVTKEQFAAIIEKTRQFGEPGFVFAKDENQLFNPCQPASARVQIKGKEGYSTIGDIKIGNEIACVEDGKKGWTTVLGKWSTGTKPVFRYVTQHGGVFLGTEDHQVLQGGVKVPAQQASSIDYWFVATDSANSKVITDPIVSREYVGEEEVFDLTVDNASHTYWTDGCIVSNCFEVAFIPLLESICGVQFCNLTSQNGAMITSRERFRDATKAATIIGTLQAAYTTFPYLSKTARRLTEDEALLGVSITGMMDNPQILLDPVLQREMAQYAVQVNTEWAKKVGINPAARVTVIKPEGTSSLVLKAASGIHPHHARRYFRRIQCNQHDNVYRHFKKTNPHACEESLWSATKTDDVITFPITISEAAMVKEDLTAIKHLELIKSTQENWIVPGTSPTNTKPITHNVSCTVRVAEDEWTTVIDYLYQHRNAFAAVSLLPSTGDKLYKQAPMEAVITEEDERKWQALISQWKHVDFTTLLEEEDDTQMQAEAVCAGGQCLVT